VTRLKSGKKSETPHVVSYISKTKRADTNRRVFIGRAELLVRRHVEDAKVCHSHAVPNCAGSILRFTMIYCTKRMRQKLAVAESGMLVNVSAPLAAAVFVSCAAHDPGPERLKLRSSAYGAPGVP
jgi:hypothetical protein